PESAARRVEKIVELEVPDPAARFAALRARQEVFHVAGRDRGIAIELEIAIAVARRCVARAGDADERGNAFNDLGVSLGVFGERENGIARLEAAVAAFRTALEERLRERVPLDWAGTQNN